MLQVSDTAAMAFRAFLDQDDVHGNAIRLERGPDPAGDASMTIRFASVEAPDEGDVPVEAPGIEVYVAPELTAPLADAYLDAEITPEGAELTLRKQG